MGSESVKAIDCRYRTVKLCVTVGPGAYCAFPGWEAWMVQVPGLRRNPFPWEEMNSVTGSPELSETLPRPMHGQRPAGRFVNPCETACHTFNLLQHPRQVWNLPHCLWLSEPLSPVAPPYTASE